MEGFFSIEDEKKWINVANIVRVGRSSMSEGSETWSVHLTDGQIIQVSGIDFYRFERMLRQNHVDLYDE